MFGKLKFTCPCKSQESQIEKCDVNFLDPINDIDTFFTTENLLDDILKVDNCSSPTQKQNEEVLPISVKKCQKMDNYESACGNEEIEIQQPEVDPL